jgi:hypothetical protein
VVGEVGNGEHRAATIGSQKSKLLFLYSPTTGIQEYKSGPKPPPAPMALILPNSWS